MSLKFKTVLMIAVAMLQLTILSHFTPFGIVPNYILIFTLAISVICDKGESVVFATITGLLTDMLTGAQIGLNTLLYMYIAISVIIIISVVYNKSMKIVIPMSLAVFFLHELLFGIFSSLLRGRAFHLNAITSVVIPAAFVNTAVFITVYLVLSRLRFEKKRKGIKYERQI